MVNINIPLPDSCASCPLSVRHFGKLYCPPLDGRVGNEGKDERCPLHSVTIKDTADKIKVTNCNDNDLISRADALSCFHDWIDQRGDVHTADEMPEYQRIEQLPDVQPEHPMVDIAKITMAMAKKADLVAVTRCKDCKFGEQDEVGRWFCRSLGCQIGNEDGSGFCADAERRTDE